MSIVEKRNMFFQALLSPFEMYVLEFKIRSVRKFVYFLFPLILCLGRDMEWAIDLIT